LHVYIVVIMKTVSVATLKQKLSEYLRRVEQGDEIVVTSHRRRVARVIPEPDSGIPVRRPTHPLSRLAEIRGVKAKRGFSSIKTLVDDRRRR
jgi:prevent-host-death family protein